MAVVSCNDIYTFSSIFTRAAQTFVNFFSTISTSVTGPTFALITVDSIYAFAMDAGIVPAIILIKFAIFAPGSRQTPTLVAVGSIYTSPPVLTWIGQTLVNWAITAISTVSWMAITLI